MTVAATDLYKNELLTGSLDQNLILKIEGIDDVYGAREVLTQVKIGMPNLKIGNFKIGGTFADPNSKDYISIQNTTKNFSQEISPDQKNSSTVPVFKIELIDFNGEVTENFEIEMLGKKAYVYSTVNDLAWPRDSIDVVRGIISDVTTTPTSYIFSISNAEQLKRQDIYLEYSGQLAGDLLIGATSVNLDNVKNLIAPQDVLSTYFLINDEIIKLGGLSGNSATGLIRAQYGTVQENHDIESDIEVFYVLEGHPIDLALKTMLSNGGNAYLESQAIDSINYVSSTIYQTNSVVIKDRFLIREKGIIQGDTLSITGSAIGGNNVTDAEILSITEFSEGYYLEINQALTDELNTTGIASFKSKYDTLPEESSLGISPDLIDIASHLRIKNLLGALPDVQIIIKDSVSGKDLIDEEMYFPFNLYSIPRNARVGINAQLPPLASNSSVILSNDNIINPESIKPTRGISQFFYNAIVYKFGYDPYFDEFLSGEIFQSSTSTNRIKIGDKGYEVESLGLIDNSQTRNFLQSASKRLLIRYQFGAETMEIETQYKDGVLIDVGDAILLDATNLQIADTELGKRSISSKIYEVINKSLDTTTGNVKLTLLNTIFKSNRRFVTIGPSSKLKGTSTTTLLRLKQSFGHTGNEITKWVRYNRQWIRIHSPDYSFDETRRVLRFSQSELNAIELEVALPSAPLEDYVIEQAEYFGDTDDNAIFKAAHGSWGAQIVITAGTSNTVFAVSSTALLFVGQFIRVHNSDYSIDSGLELKRITDITGLTITVEDLGFTPASGFLIDTINFTSDKGAPYVFF